MAKSTYSISVIRVGRETDYYDFWNRDVDENSTGERLHSDLIGFTEIVEATSLYSAISMVKAKYPCNIISEKSSSKIR